MNIFTKNDINSFGMRERDNPIIVFFTMVASYLVLGVVSAFDTYGWVGKFSYIASFMDLLYLIYKCLSFSMNMKNLHLH